VTERPHGRWRYKLDRCRCFTCRRAYAEYSKACREGRADRVTLRVPVAVVCERLDSFTAAGVTDAAVAALTGLPVRLLRDWRNRDQRDVRADLAARLLAHDPATPVVVPPAPGSAFRRRLQALVALGWQNRVMADALGVREPNFSRLFRCDALPDTRQAIARMYDDLSMQVPEWSTGMLRAKARARRSRWFPPLAWDDTAIDDPDALPCLLPPIEPVARDLELAVQHVVAGHEVEVTNEIRCEITRRLPDTPVSEVAVLARSMPRQISHIRRRLALAC
jgi:hypothetical protein